MAGNNAHPYRTVDRQGRGPLTLREKAGAAMAGLASFEPILEMHCKGLDAGLPQSERLKSAAKLADSTATDRIYRLLQTERDSCVQEALAYAFLRAYQRKMKQFDDALCTKYTAMGAQNTVNDKNSYSNVARGQAASILIGSSPLSQAARSSLETVAYGS